MKCPVYQLKHPIYSLPPYFIWAYVLYIPCKFMRFCLNPINLWETRKNSNRMRTARLLPVSPSMHCSGGRCTCLGGVPAWGCTCPGRYTAVGGGVPAQGVGCTCQGGCTFRGGCTWWGVYLPGGVPGGRGVPAWEVCT